MGTQQNPVEALDQGNEVDLKVTGSTLVWSTDVNSGDFNPSSVGVKVSAVSGITVSAVISFGTNSPDYDNVVPATLLPLLGQLTDLAPISLLSPTKSIPASTDVYCKVITAAIGTTFKIKPFLMGFYF